MADVRTTLKEAWAGGQVDYARLDATTEEEIHRQQEEDGEPGSTVHDDWVPEPKYMRKHLGLTQAQMAAAIGVPLGTWRNWEQGRVWLDPANLALLRIVWKEPEAAFRALGKSAA
jgi:putative transcriptional regulator